MTDAEKDRLRVTLLVGGLLVAAIAGNLVAFGAVGKPAPEDAPLVRALGDPAFPPVVEAAPLVLFPEYLGERNAAMRLDRRFAPTFTGYGAYIRARVSTACLPASIKRALQTVQAACGPVTVTSAHRPGARVAGSGRVSMHDSCRAADFQIKNWRCVLTTLTRKVWPYGLSTDYVAVNHYHISDSRREGRFAHWRGSRVQYAAKAKKRTRYARAYRQRVQVAYVQERGL